MNQSADPIVALNYSRDSASPNVLRAIRWWVWLTWATALGATIALFVKTETVLIGGPAVALLAMFLMWRALRGRHVAAMLLSAAHLAVCVLFVALVRLFHWSPGAAEAPFQWMSCTYLVGTLIGSVFTSRKPIAST